jgi:hypothetical protein
MPMDFSEILRSVSPSSRRRGNKVPSASIYWSLRSNAISPNRNIGFTKWSKSFAGVSSDFSYSFECFEALGALAQLEENDEESLKQSLSSHDGRVRMSIGRIGWREVSRDRFIREFSRETVRDGLLKSGFAKGSVTYWDLYNLNLRRVAGWMSWR